MVCQQRVFVIKQVATKDEIEVLLTEFERFLNDNASVREKGLLSAHGAAVQGKCQGLPYRWQLVPFSFINDVDQWLPG